LILKLVTTLERELCHEQSCSSPVEALDEESDYDEDEEDEDDDDEDGSGSENDADFDPKKAQANPECKQQ